MSGQEIRVPGADHPIALQVADGLATAISPSGHMLAASRSAIVLAEADLPRVTYFPRENVDASALTPTETKTWCPYKGEAAYDAVLGDADKAWTYYDAAPAVADIAGHVAFYPDTAKVGQEALPTPSAEALSILTFWFEETKPEQRFEQDDAFDATISERFGAYHHAAAAGELDGWDREPDGALARIILLDQFSRNMFRGRAEAFAQDAKARSIADRIVSRGFDLALAPERRAFAYMPFMHAEDMRGQNRSVRLYEDRLAGSAYVRHALEHRTEIHRDGRFKGRDIALGR